MEKHNPTNIDECNKVAYCFDCIYEELGEFIAPCPKKKEFMALNPNPIFFLNPILQV